MIATLSCAPLKNSGLLSVGMLRKLLLNPGGGGICPQARRSNDLHTIAASGLRVEGAQTGQVGPVRMGRIVVAVFWVSNSKRSSWRRVTLFFLPWSIAFFYGE